MTDNCPAVVISEIREDTVVGSRLGCCWCATKIGCSVGDKELQFYSMVSNKGLLFSIFRYIITRCTHVLTTFKVASTVSPLKQATTTTTNDNSLPLTLHMYDGDVFPEDSLRRADPRHLQQTAGFAGVVTGVLPPDLSEGQLLGVGLLSPAAVWENLSHTSCPPCLFVGSVLNRSSFVCSLA